MCACYLRHPSGQIRRFLCSSRQSLVVVRMGPDKPSITHRPVATVPDNQLEQAVSAMEVLGNLQHPTCQQQAPDFTFTDQNVEVVMALTKTKRKHKLDRHVDEATREAIFQKIATSMAKKAAKPRHNCPACGVLITRIGGILRHMDSCCPDLLTPEERAKMHSNADKPEVLQSVITAAAAGEHQKRRRALEITFLSSKQPAAAAAAAPAAAGAAAAVSAAAAVAAVVEARAAVAAAAAPAAVPPVSSSSSVEDLLGDDDDDVAAAGDEGFEGGYSKHTRHRIAEAPGDIAAELGVPLARAERLLRQAMRSVPIALDHDTPLDVVYEDSDFVAVNKAVGFHTAPVHRWQGGSIVNMLLAHFSRTAAAAAAAGSSIPADASAAAAADGSSIPAAAASSAQQQQDEQQQQQQQQHDKQQQPRASHVAAVKPYVVHRLDYNTSGLLLFGKRREVVPGVNKQFRERTVSKEYLAITVGIPQPPAHEQQSQQAAELQQQSGRHVFSVNAGIDRHELYDTARCIAPSGKPALTHVEVLSVNPDIDLRSLCEEGTLFHERGGEPGSAARDSLRGVALVRCYPKSGRTHQIRLHMAHLGHPLIGDEVYGVTGPWIGRQALHARALAIRHPLTQQPMKFVAPLHADFEAALQVLGLGLPAGV